MNAESGTSWALANQRQLMAAILATRERIGARGSADAPLMELALPPALARLHATFQLSAFEYTVLLACAAMELDDQFAGVCAAAQRGAAACVSFELLFAVCADAHWDATSPAGPLRYWRLIEIVDGPTLMSSPLRIDERILHYLTGTSYLDRRLAGIVEAVEGVPNLPPSQRAVAERAAGVWAAAEPGQRPVLIELSGADGWTRQAVAANLCALAGLRALRVAASTVPATPAELFTLARLVEREALLDGCAVLMEREGGEASGFVESLGAPLIVTTPQRGGGVQRAAAFFDIPRPSLAEQRDEWLARRGGDADGLDAVLAQFNLSSEQIRTTSLRAGDGGPDVLWDACRLQTRTGLDGLARRVETKAGWEALVLPPAQQATLHGLAGQMRHRARVYTDWGFDAGGGRGLGLTALFAGVSGTGKTTAAEVLAHELKLDLYCIDLSQVVSKYIGETEKCLRRIFDAAEQGGALLFFDEADALFGKRTEVKDSHDRYANIEVSYLLQRMEAYRGLAVLATNMKQALDPAFLRRIRFVVSFPFPDAALREEIWRRAIPATAPTEGIDVTMLAQLTVSGGSIRNIALNAAFLAAEGDRTIRMSHLLEAARAEYLKMEKPLTEREIKGWV